MKSRDRISIITPARGESRDVNRVRSEPGSRPLYTQRVPRDFPPSVDLPVAPTFLGE